MIKDWEDIDFIGGRMEKWKKNTLPVKSVAKLKRKLISAEAAAKQIRKQYGKYLEVIGD